MNNNIEYYYQQIIPQKLKYQNANFNLPMLRNQTLHQNDPILKRHYQTLYHAELNRRLQYIINQPFHK